ncbi:hypothetical protein [Roseimarinus sediminis]|uniref:hypothetical protein n=1 Tax=Roseimarinus sediminis TaxID=1610899 RepID=UPI003D1D750B
MNEMIDEKDGRKKMVEIAGSISSISFNPIKKLIIAYYGKPGMAELQDRNSGADHEIRFKDFGFFRTVTAN